MNELSLFSGAGGGLLATKHLLGWNCMGYVEIDEYCQAVLAQRIKDGYLDPAPIFGDIRRFVSEGYAEAYRGMVDVITAGFPCQPFSQASRYTVQSGNRWPETADTIEIIRPTYVFLENVLGIRNYLPQIKCDLCNLGYKTKTACLGAFEVDAPDIRHRLWIFGYSDSETQPERQRDDEMGRLKKAPEGFTVFNWWKVRPIIYGMDDGVAHKMDRAKAIGNGQVPAVVELAWKILT